jgi:hypothetical protein
VNIAAARWKTVSAIVLEKGGKILNRSVLWEHKLGSRPQHHAASLARRKFAMLARRPNAVMHLEPALFLVSFVFATATQGMKYQTEAHVATNTA